MTTYGHKFCVTSRILRSHNIIWSTFSSLLSPALWDKSVSFFIKLLSVKESLTFSEAYGELSLSSEWSSSSSGTAGLSVRKGRVAQVTFHTNKSTQTYSNVGEHKIEAKWMAARLCTHSVLSDLCGSMSTVIPSASSCCASLSSRCRRSSCCLARYCCMKLFWLISSPIWTQKST